MKRYMFALGLLGASAAIPAEAFGCVTVSASAPSLRYDPLSLSTIPAEPISLTFVRQPQTTGYVSGVRYQLASPFQFGPIFTIGTQGPRFDIESHGGTVLAGQTNTPLTPANSAIVEFGDSDASNMRSADALRLHLEPGLAVASDDYVSRLNLRYECVFSDGTVSAVMERQNVLSLTAVVPNLISVNLAGGGKSGVIDFGDFQQTIQSAEVQVRSTGPYRVTTSSTNLGSMKLEGGLPGHPTIPYNLYLDGHAIGAATARTYQPAGAHGIRLPLEAEVTSDLRSYRAGLYKDEVTVTFTPSGL